ncbi:MAG: thiol oxidoreductase, partial [Bacteroidia bacterium]|nr:thiol oxidoreductase [Bacteroidia bacterium]
MLKAIRSKSNYCLAALLVVSFAVGCRKYNEFSEDELDKRYAGGSNTVFDESGGAFTHPFSGMSEHDMEVHETGDAHFEASFVTAPSFIRPGLGPIYNNVSCASCHIADGRGKPALPGQPLLSMLFRISIPGEGPHGEPNAAPGFGGQLQTASVVGKPSEGSINIVYTEEQVALADGEVVNLRRPTYSLQNTYIPAPAGLMLSPRVAPPVFGLGLLQAISDQTLLSWTDEMDIDGDGISGKVNYVWNISKNKTTIGRFGWKAGAPDLLQQTAGAYSEDMGITNSLFPAESSFGQ